MIPNTMELYDLYKKLFFSFKISKISDKSTNNPNKKKFSTLQRYDRLALKVGIDIDITHRKNSKIAENTKPLNLELLFIQNNLHDRIARLLCICCNYDKVSNYNEYAVMSLFGKIVRTFDYFELELSKLRKLYIFKPANNPQNLVDEILEKILIPQISIVFNSLMQKNFSSFSKYDDNHDYLVLKHISDVLTLIIKNNFDLTVSYKNNLKKFIQDELKIKLSACGFYKIFGNNEDKYFPSIDLIDKWINDWLIGECKISEDEVIINQIKSQHILLCIFRKIKLQMDLNKNKYYFKYLIIDLYYYLNELEKIIPLTESPVKNIDKVSLQCLLNHIPSKEQETFFNKRKALLNDNFIYFKDNFKDELIQEIAPIYFPEHKIYRNLNFLNNSNIPPDLIEYLYFGLFYFYKDQNIEKIINLLKENNSSNGITIICLFTEAIKYLIDNKLELARMKITEAYNKIDTYPIGTMFYRNIFAFYIGICQIYNKTPNQFIKQINYFSEYNRLSFNSVIMHQQYNLVTKSQRRRPTHVENSNILRVMTIFNQFCIKLNLNPNLLFNPFKEIEKFHQIIWSVKNGTILNIKAKINSLNDILEYIKSDKKNNIFNKFKNFNKNPKISFTQDSLQDLYESRVFYTAIIEDLELTKILKHTYTILSLL